jgi:hypothetical protein
MTSFEQPVRRTLVLGIILVPLAAMAFQHPLIVYDWKDGGPMAFVARIFYLPVIMAYGWFSGLDTFGREFVLMLLWSAAIFAFFWS